MAVFHNNRNPGLVRLGYSFRPEGGPWQEGAMPRAVDNVSGGGTYNAIAFGDVAVVYDRKSETPSADGGYLAAAYATDPNSGPPGIEDQLVLVNRWTPGAGWGNWVEVFRRTPPIAFSRAIDKPFLVAGEPDEFYLTWWAPNPQSGEFAHGYARTENGGQAHSDWTAGPVFDASTGSDFPNLWAPQPAVWDDGNLYVVFPQSTAGGRFRFLQGVDDPATGGVQFNLMETKGASGNEPLQLEVDPVVTQSLTTALPSVSFMLFAPQLVADPTYPKRLYVAYHDKGALPQDVDVLVNSITLVGNLWYFGKAARLPSPAPLGCGMSDVESDQFLPMLTVDDEGRVHVMYYDDRDFCQADSTPDTARYNVVLGASCNGGQSFSVFPFTPDSMHGVAFLDFILERHTEPPVYDVREYNGLTWSRTPAGTLNLRATFSGTSLEDDDPHDNLSVAYSILLEY